jgi:hypothetical protein
MVVTCSCVTTSMDTFAPLPLTTPEWSPKPSGRSECPSNTATAGTAVTCRAVVGPAPLRLGGPLPFSTRPGRRPGHRGEKGAATRANAVVGATGIEPVTPRL